MLQTQHISIVLYSVYMPKNKNKQRKPPTPCPPWDDSPKLQRLPGWDPATSHTS